MSRLNNRMRNGNIGDVSGHRSHSRRLGFFVVGQDVMGHGSHSRRLGFTLSVKTTRDIAITSPCVYDTYSSRYPVQPHPLIIFDDL